MIRGSLICLINKSDQYHQYVKWCPDLSLNHFDVSHKKMLNFKREHSFKKQLFSDDVLRALNFHRRKELFKAFSTNDVDATIKFIGTNQEDLQYFRKINYKERR